MKVIVAKEVASNHVRVISPSPEFLDTLTGSEEEKLVIVANKEIPTGEVFEIIDIEDLPNVSIENWRYTPGKGEKISKEYSPYEIAIESPNIPGGNT